MRVPSRKDRDPKLRGEAAPARKPRRDPAPAGELIRPDDDWRELVRGLEGDPIAEETETVPSRAERLHPDWLRATRALPMVAVVGRPNVGKSTLFNRIIGRRKAVVHDRPGVTRDRNLDVADWLGRPFLCVDTGGFDTELDDPLLENVVEQARMAIDEADVIILLFALGESAHPADAEMVRLLRTTRKPVLAAVNKCDNEREELESADFYQYGIDRLYPISALHGRGVGDLLDDVVAALPATPAGDRGGAAEGAGRPIALAIVGRQNVGKSTLINRLAGEPRVIASPVPGTTRDAIDTLVTAPGGRPFILIDTAGIRRRGKIERGVERLSVMSAMLSLRRADVAALVIDAAEGITEQDAHVAGYCLEAGLPTMILVNKWDLVEKDHRTADEFTKRLEKEWQFLRYAPVLYMSGLTGQRATRVYEIAERVYENSTRRVPTPALNEKLAEWVERKPPAMKRNRRPKVRYGAQVGVQPPRFAVFVNDPQLFHFSYERYLVNRIRETWDFEGTPIKLHFRRSSRRKGEGED